MTIHRIISAFLVIAVIAPLHIIIATLKLIFSIFNHLHYYNFWNKVEVPPFLYEKFGQSTAMEIAGRIALILVDSFLKFVEDIKMLKTCKF